MSILDALIGTGAIVGLMAAGGGAAWLIWKAGQR